ncbi:MAG: glutathione peroxidase [Tissierellia bacterium]|nr:glutathione peroxidase [Tissierellia bacterium]
MSVYDFTVKDFNGEDISLEKYKQKVLLIVNTASKCGFTHQYEGLQRLYEKFKDRGFEVLAFPCNQFLHQEPKDNKEIQSFCAVNFGISFPVLGKIKVNGKDAEPLYEYLKKGTDGKRISWNFNKFLVNKKGEPIKHYGSKVKPMDLEEDILKLLEESC